MLGVMQTKGCAHIPVSVLDLESWSYTVYTGFGEIKCINSGEVEGKRDGSIKS